MTYKNILAITGSPRAETLSTSKKMLTRFCSDVKNNDTKIKIVDSYKVNVKPCIHCRHCAKNLPSYFCQPELDIPCIYDNDDTDDFAAIDKALREADLLIIASPVYVLSFPAPLKAILDRLQKYFEAAVKIRKARISRKNSLGITMPISKQKDAVLIACCGSKDRSGFDIMEAQLKLSCKAINAKLIKTIYAADTDTP